MSLLTVPVALVLCHIVYSRMYKREVPEPIGKKKAALPVLLGLFAPLLSFGVFLLLGLLIQNTVGGKLADHIPNLVLKSLSFFLDNPRPIT